METLHLITILFIIIGISQIFDGLRNVITGALRGSLDTRFPMYVGLLAIWLIGIPFGYILAFNFRLGVAGIAIGPGIAMVLACYVLLHRFQDLTREGGMINHRPRR